MNLCWHTALNSKDKDGHVCCRDKRIAREAQEKEEEEFQLLMEMEEKKKQQQEYAAEQVRKVKVSITVNFMLLIIGVIEVLENRYPTLSSDM